MKFSTASTGQYFFEMLAQTRMAQGQSPLDFYQSVEIAVMQGVGIIRTTLTTWKGLCAKSWLQCQLLLLDFPLEQADGKEVLSIMGCHHGSETRAATHQQSFAKGTSFT